MYRSVLFTGCAAGSDGAPPVHHATIALARALRLELWEAPAAGCCGARPDRAVSGAQLRQALTPLGESVQQGLDVMCLSPACRCVVATHVAGERDQMGGTGEGSAARVPRIHDVVRVLCQADGLERLTRAVRNSLAPLRVAIHATCHADHWLPAMAAPGAASAVTRERVTPAATQAQPAPRPQPALLARAVQWARQPASPLAGDNTGGSTPRSAPSPSDTGMADLIATTGATVLADVSLDGHGHCATVQLRRAGVGPVARCLALAAQGGADLLVTPCFLCFSDLNHYQRTLERADPARNIPVLHLSQILGVACGVAPLQLDLTRTTASARCVLGPYVT